MPTPHGFATTSKNPDRLITEVNRRFSARENRVGSEILRRFCFIDSGAISKSGVYPHSVLGFKDQIKGDTELRDFDEASVIEYGPVIAERRDGPAIKLPIDDDYDLYGLVSQGMERSMVPWGLRLWVRLVAQLINGNGLAYDDKTFFATDHPVNPLRPELLAFSNDLSGAPIELDEDGWATAVDALLSIPSMSGTTLANQGMVRPAVIVPTKKLMVKALRLFGLSDAHIAAVVGPANAAASVTVVTAGDADAIWIPEMVIPATAATKKRWYVASDVGYWPIIIRETLAPHVKMSSGGDVFEHSADSRVLYARAKVGVGFASPHGMLRLQTA